MLAATRVRSVAEKTCFKKYLILLERVNGIEPSSSAWKAVALPLSYTRKYQELWQNSRSSSRSPAGRPALGRPYSTLQVNPGSPACYSTPETGASTSAPTQPLELHAGRLLFRCWPDLGAQPLREPFVLVYGAVKQLPHLRGNPFIKAARGVIIIVHTKGECFSFRKNTLLDCILL